MLLRGTEPRREPVFRDRYSDPVRQCKSVRGRTVRDPAAPTIRRSPPSPLTDSRHAGSDPPLVVPPRPFHGAPETDQRVVHVDNKSNKIKGTGHVITLLCTESPCDGIVEVAKSLPEIGVLGSSSDPPCQCLTHPIGRLADVFRELLDFESRKRVRHAIPLL